MKEAKSSKHYKKRSRVRLNKQKYMKGSAEQIKERLDIVEVLGSYIKLEKSGINYKARCPFHNERTASFFVSPTRGNFYCFGCQASGDIFTFVEKFEGLDFKGALELLASKAGIDLSKTENKELEKGKSRLIQTMEKATVFFEQNLENSNLAKSYIEKRGISKDSAKKWRIGFIEDDWRKLYNFLEGQGFTKEEMLSAGLIKKAPTREAVGEPTVNVGLDRYYDTFRSRIMFPIFDSAGRVIAFSGRLLGENDKAPKYLNSPETEIFRKSEVLYGFHVAKNVIRKLDYTVIVEGQIDIVLSHQAGVSNTVASSGTSITEEHLKKIQKLSNRVIIGYDSDNAGEKAALRAAEMALGLGMEVKIASLEEGEDPASIVEKNPEKWKEVLRNAKNVVEFALDKIVKEKKGSSLMKEVGKQVLPLIKIIKSDIEKSHLVKIVSDRIGVREESVWNDLKNLKEEGNLIEALDKENIKSDLESVLVGLIFINKDNSGDDLLEKYSKIIGKDRAIEILSNYEKDKDLLMFQSEKFIDGKDMDKISQEILNRIELEHLKKELKENTGKLDKSDTEDTKKIEAEIKVISNRIKELNLYT